MQEVKIVKNILTANNYIASANRKTWHDEQVVAFNVIGSPGAGKTALIEALSEHIGHNLKISVIVGDLQTARDAERLRDHGLEAIQINTGLGCHLDAAMVADAYRDLTVKPDLLIVENVGNLVCPAAYDLGEKIRIVVLSVTEGDDKPFKYPATFRGADLVLVNKIDLLPYVNFDVKMVTEGLKILAPQARVYPVSAQTGEGMRVLLDWLGGNIVGSNVS